MRRFYRVMCAVPVCVLILLLSACSDVPAVSRTGFALDTVVSITIYEADAHAESLLDDCFAEMERLESLFSAMLPDSDISRINNAGGAPVTVAAETAELLTLSLQYASLSDGAFDITLRSVTELWDFSASVLPEADVLAAAASTVDYHNLTVSGTRVTLTDGALDLGGIAKGYIADRMRELLEEGGVTSALIDLGGNIVVCGSISGEDWRIGIKDPADVSELCAIVTGQELSVVTSGIYERGFTLDGVRYHHLLSPETGMPVQNGLASVTIVCESSVQADALSTACFVLGEERALELIGTWDGVEALFVRQDGTLHASDGLSYVTA